MGNRRKNAVSATCLLVSAATVAFAAVGATATAQAAGTVKVLAQGNANLGSVFYGGVLIETNGKVYATATDGATSGNGSVLQLMPPAAGKTVWTETVIHRFAGFPSDGQNTQAALIKDKAGALYGTTTGGGANNQGVVFKLIPPAAGQKVWKETILYNFGAKAHDASQSRAPLVADAKGNLYGLTIYGGASTRCSTGCGTVFKLTPPAAGKTVWTETVIHSFGTGANDGQLPELGGLILNAQGEVFGTTGNGGKFGSGIAFKLTPPAAGKTAWTETILTNFGGGAGGNVGGATGGLVFDKTGALYGALTGGGTGFGSVYKLTPPASGKGAWKQAELYAFKTFDDCNHPQASLIVDRAGTLWGTAQYGGKTPPASRVAAGCVFSVKPSGASSKETIVYTFTGPSGGVPLQGSMPYAALAADAKGNLFGTTISGGAHSLGTVFELTGSGYLK